MPACDDTFVHQALKPLSGDLPDLVRRLGLQGIPDMDTWSGIVGNKLLPRLDPGLPLLAAVCGGGSSGKSSLFNALVGRPVSPVGGRAGMNRRILLGAGETYLQRQDILTAVFEPFGCVPETLGDPKDLTVPGGPLFAATDALPSHLAVMDTPDFDTGARGSYTNRQAARQAMEAADIFIYIFTNANYSNRDNTDFIAEMLTGIGLRKCFLVYRVYPSFQPDEVLDHAMTVARNIYGDAAERSVLGVYRVDEDNDVAAGRRFMTLKPVRHQDPPFLEALNDLDIRTLRMALNASILRDALAIANEVVGQAKVSMDALRLYADAVEAAQSRCTREALVHFPMDGVIRRFAQIWMAHDPPHIRLMRKTGSVLEWPVKMLAGAIRRAGSGDRSRAGRQAESDYAERVKEDLITAANSLHMHMVGTDVSVVVDATDPAARDMLQIVHRIRAGRSASGLPRPEATDRNASRETQFVVPVHPAVFHAQAAIKNRQWRSTLQAILDRKDVIISLSDGVENELQALAEDYRRRMGLWDKLRQSFAAFLNVLPATAAVTYILHTGDPVGAAGIKVKLTGLFGLKDLYALIAIPATSGLKKADQRQLEALMAPIARTWLQHKVRAVGQLFREMITGTVLSTAAETLDRSGRLIENIEANVARIAADAAYRMQDPGPGA